MEQRPEPAPGMPSGSSSSKGSSLARDPEALGRAMESCRRYLNTVASHRIAPGLKAKEGASDIVQETFLEAQRKLDTFQGGTERELRLWLRRILLHKLSQLIRRYTKTGKRKVGREVSLDQPSPGGRQVHELAESTLSPSGQLMRREEEKSLEEVLKRLKERDRKVILWRNQERCAWDEIGQRLGGSAEMARKVWARAIEKLLDELGGDSGSLMKRNSR
jgi:RNA polymerase sigma-70 factor, ECF subfamily